MALPGGWSRLDAIADWCSWYCAAVCDVLGVVQDFDDADSQTPAQEVDFSPQVPRSLALRARVQLIGHL